MATFTIDPTVPPNSENPQNGATRIRNVAGWLLNILGLNSAVQATITASPNAQIDLTSGRILAGALPGANHLRVSNSGTSILAVSADVVYTLNPTSYNLTQNLSFNQGCTVVGAQVGSVPNARDQTLAFNSNTFYHLYCIGGPGVNAGTLASLTSPPTGPTLPASYTSWAYLGTYLTDGSGNVLPMVGVGNTIWYFAPISVLFNGSATVNSKIDLSPVVPAIASNVILTGTYTGVTDGTSSIQISIGIQTSSTLFQKLQDVANIGISAGSDFQFKVPQFAQAVFYIWTHGTSLSLNMSVAGYEVPNGST